MTVAGDIARVALDAAYSAFGTPALYTGPDGQGGPCLVINGAQDRTAQFEGARPVGRGDLIKVRASECVAPAKNGVFQYQDGSGTFTIVAEPLAEDPERLEWTCRVSFRAL